VVLTPLVVARELLRVVQSQHTGLAGSLLPGLVGVVFAFIAGLLALKWLSRWLETGRWYLFGIYCLLAASVVAYLYHAGY
jgi:undecaprenyl-diphosphatase